ncbi:MAG: hypothetical protein RI900_1611 [Actinomycetota bacterium]|jgi:beta-glucosidase
MSTFREVADELVAAMTIDELLDCTDGDLEFWAGLADMIGGGILEHTFPGGSCARLGVQGIRFSDGPRGVVVGGSTCFPVSMARGAAWDPALERAIGDAIGRELRVRDANFYGGVCINLLRHPAWGRAQETYGEDPLLLGEMGTALTEGVQQHVMACVKHYALNSMENARFSVDVMVDDDVLHEVYLPHFERVVRAGVASVMSAYNSVNGEWCGHHRHLLTEVLRHQWGFDGFVVSDFIYGIRDAAASVLAGLDIEMPFRMVRHQHLRTALDRGEVTLDHVRESVARTIATQLRFGSVLAAPAPDPTVVAGARHRDLAYEAAVRGTVLLRNERAQGEPVLPLMGGASVALIGWQAAGHALGDHGSSRVVPPHVVSLLDGLSAVHDGEVRHHDGADPVAAAGFAAESDVAVVMVGYDHRDEGEYVGLEGTTHLATLFPPQQADSNELLKAGFAKAQANRGDRSLGPGGDRASLHLSEADVALVRAVAAANPRTVVLVVAGSAVMMPWADEVAAVAMVWYPGQEGGRAIADVLTGNRFPVGRLPLTIPRSEAHLPHFDASASSAEYDRWHGYTKLHHDGHEAHFPFGFGLGYTTFTIDEVAVRGGVVVATVTNTGLRAGSHLVQLYGGSVASPADGRPEWLLCGFARSGMLAPGQRAEVEVPLQPWALRRWDPASSTMQPPSGTYRISARSHADHHTGPVVELVL